MSNDDLLNLLNFPRRLIPAASAISVCSADISLELRTANAPKSIVRRFHIWF
jgi:hypothetical protein